MLQIKQEFVSDVWNELRPLLAKHWDEVGSKRSPLNPAKDVYVKSEESGVYILYTMRNNGVLIGYAGFFIVPSIHEQGTEMACSDVIFVLPEFRGIRSVKFIKKIEKLLESEGIMLITMSSKAARPLDNLFARLGYSCTEKVYTKNVESVDG